MPILNNNYLNLVNDKNHLIYPLDTSLMQCYCTIQLDYYNNLQLFYYNKISNQNSYSQQYSIPIIFVAKTAKNICILLRYHINVINNISSDHALYLGRELMKAEIALIMKQNFVQD